MQIPTSKKWISVLGLLLATLASARRSHADQQDAVIGTIMFLTPSEVGAALSGADMSRQLVVGWAWQIPIERQDPLGILQSTAAVSPHRLVPSVELLHHAGVTSWRGRFGYRYAGRWVLAGAGMGFDGAGIDVSPEVGLKLLGGKHREDGVASPAALSLHLLVRAEIELGSDHFGGGTVTLGWTLL